MKLDEYFFTLQNKNVFFLEAQEKDFYFIKYLFEHGISVSVRYLKDLPSSPELLSELNNIGIKSEVGLECFENSSDDIIFCSSNMSSDQFYVIEEKLNEQNITSELEVFLQLCPCKKIGVTGSFGKTSTAALITGLLREAGFNVYTRTDLGKSLFEKIDEIREGDYVVLDIPYLQLAYIKSSPEIAVVTNIYSYPIDKHMTFERYIKIIENIYLHQNIDGLAVFNYDNAVTRKFISKARGGALTFSLRRVIGLGTYLQDEYIWITDTNGTRKLLPVSNILLPGKINLTNYLASIAAIDAIVQDSYIRKFIPKFKGAEHHFEFIREFDRVKYYNNSVASTPAKTVAAFQAFPQDIVLITGGNDDGEFQYKALGMEIVAFVKMLILVGTSVTIIRKTIENTPLYDSQQIIIVETDNLNQAILIAREYAKQGDEVLLSPCCKMFDEFNDYVECGNEFKRIINSL